MPADCVEIVNIEKDAMDLAMAYIESRVLASTSIDDATHVAVATVANADLILSWNFKHIVNFQKIRKFNAVNLANGYRMIDIRSPLELGIDYENEEI